jgi:hypothetical protein
MIQNHCFHPASSPNQHADLPGGGADSKLDEKAVPEQVISRFRSQLNLPKSA